MTLSANAALVYEADTFSKRGSLPQAAEKIYEGSAVQRNSSGYAAKISGAGQEFAGFADGYVDNSAGSAGDRRCEMRQFGFAVLSITGVTAITDVGKAVFASDENTFSLVGSTGTPIGEIVRWISGTKAIVKFEAHCLKDFGGAGQMFKDVKITTAQMLALNATPVSLIAAPGAGKAIIFEGAMVFLDYNSAAYGAIHADDNLSFKYTNGSGAAVAGCETASFLDLTADAIRWVLPTAAASGVSDIIPVANAALVLHMANGEVTTGDSPLYIRVYYRVVPTVLA